MFVKIKYISLIVATSLIISCSDQQEKNELVINPKCNINKDTCIFELVDEKVLVQTNILGKVTEKIISKKQIKNISGDLTWLVPDNTGNATNNELVASGLSGVCPSAGCTSTTNPTAYKLNEGNHLISISGTVTIDGKEISLDDVKPLSITTIVTHHESVTLVMPAPGATLNGVLRPVNMTTDLIVNALNLNAQAAHGTFLKINDTSFKFTCNEGYEWKDANTPPWGSSFDSKGPFRSASQIINWNGSDWNTKESANQANTVLGYPNTYHFTFGCWAKE